MKNIINKPIKYSLTCKHCGCVFEYELSDINKFDRIKCAHRNFKNKHKGCCNVEYKDEPKYRPVGFRER